MDELKDKKHLRPRDYISFSGAMFANGALTGLMQAYLMTYCLLILPSTHTVWLAPIFLAVKIWDGINDPIMGVIIDRTNTRFGKMRPYVIFTAVPFGLLTASFFLLHYATSPVLQLVLVLILYISWDMLSTLVDVPLNGMYSVITPNPKERTKLVTFSRLLGSAGGEAALVLYTVFLIIYGDAFKRESITSAALVIAVLAPVLLIWGAVISKERIASPPLEQPKLLDSFRYLKGNKPLIALLLANFFTFFRHIVSASIIYLVAIVFAAPSMQIVFSLPGALASTLGMLAAPVLRKKFDYKKIFILATVAHSVALAVVFAAGRAVMAFDLNAAMYTVAVLSFAAMLPVGLLNTVPTLMATDIIDYMELKTGRRYEGVTFSLMTLRSKISSGFKDALLIFLLVVVFKFAGDRENTSDFAPQSDYTKNGIFLMYTLIPAVLNLVSLIPLKFYKLDGKTMEEVSRELEKVRKEREAAQGEQPNIPPIPQN